mgnify:FL=1
MRLTVDALRNRTRVTNANTDMCTVDATYLEAFPEHLLQSLENTRIVINADASLAIANAIPSCLFLIDQFFRLSHCLTFLMYERLSKKLKIRHIVGLAQAK